MAGKLEHAQRAGGQALEHLLQKALREAKWKVSHPNPGSGVSGRGVALIAERQQQRLMIELKVFGEGRRDRLEPLLAQAILEIRAAAAVAATPSIPVAVIGAPSVSEKVASELLEFAARVAPEVGVGVIDQQGLRRFQGAGLDVMNAEAPERPIWEYLGSGQPHNGFLFTDTNQWLLKLMLAPLIPNRELLDIRTSDGERIEIPSTGWQTALQLAAVAEVAPRTVGRFLAQLREDGHLADTRNGFVLVRIKLLLSRWSGVLAESVQDIPAWLTARSSRPDPQAVWRGIRSATESEALRLGIGLFAAADLMGAGYVVGVPPHSYIPIIDRHLLQMLGLDLRRREGYPADMFLRIPSAARAVFRSRVVRQGFPVTDAVQTYIDLLSHPARGPAQAEVLWEKLLQPYIEGR